MTKERIYLFDTTLRDGQQTPGIDFSLEDKILICRYAGRDRYRLRGRRLSRRQSDRYGILLASKRTSKRAKFTAFGMTKRAGRSVGNDPGVQGLIQADADAICYRRQVMGLPRQGRPRL